MSRVEIYTKFMCSYCACAKAVLTKKEVVFEETDITMDAAARATMIARANGRATVPQIFINDQHIGGCDEMLALDAAGKLDSLLAA